jgi:hypothetical protein
MWAWGAGWVVIEGRSCIVHRFWGRLGVGNMKGVRSVWLFFMVMGGGSECGCGCVKCNVK